MKKCKDQQCRVDEQVYWISVFVTVTAMLTALLTVSSRTSSGRIRLASKAAGSIYKAIGSGCGALVALLVSYIFGLIHEADVKYELFPLWAVLLVLMHANASWDSIKFKDGSSIGVTILKFLFYIVYSVIIFMDVHPSSFYVPMCLLLLIACFKVAENVGVRIVISCANQLISTGVTKLDDDDDDDDDEYDYGDGDLDPFLRCSYVVYPGFPTFKAADANKVITLQEIWALQGEEGCILSSARDPLQRGRNKCLSVALFWKLLYKVVGLPTYESSHQKKAWKLISNWLSLPTDDQRCPFKVVKEELSVLHNFLCDNTGFLVYLFGCLWPVINNLLSLASVIWIYTILTIKMISHHVFTNGFNSKDFRTASHVERYSYIALLAWLAGLYMILLELQCTMMYYHSTWPRMSLLYTYLRGESWKKQNIYDRCISKVTRLILSPQKEPRKFRREEMLEQYSLLESYSSCQHFLWKIGSVMVHTFAGMRIARSGRKQGDDATLTEELKKAVIESLLQHGPHFSNGIESLEKSDLPHAVKSKLTPTCTQFNTDAATILVWHIATSICEISANPQLSETHRSDQFKTATTLSKYCAYLVAFAPDLLPGDSAITDYTCRLVAKEAYTILKDCELPNSRYCKLMEIATEGNGEIESGQRQKSSILQRGAFLGKVLETEIIELDKRWEILAAFWTEMILYLAPSDNNELAHLEKLATEQEFISRLSVLLFHAGIVDRNSLRSRHQDASTSTS